MKVTGARADPLWWALVSGTGTQKLGLPLKLKSWEPKGMGGQCGVVTSDF